MLELPEFSDIQAAQKRLAGHIALTPCAKSQTLSAMLGAEVFLKYENFQFTASFKERGALNFLAANKETHKDRLEKGVLAMSAGNHAQGLAYHAQRMGVSATIVMPKFTPNTKVEATRVFGADVHLHGETLEEARIYAEGLSQERDLLMVHPFNDFHVVAGQGTIGIEVLDAVENLDAIVVPIGGGGLIGGISLAVKTLSPDTRVIGVQAERFAGAYNDFNQVTPAKLPNRVTVAEGIAVKEPGTLNKALIQRYVDEIHTVSESDIEQSVFDLMEVEKVVTEGAGATPLALLQKHPEKFQGQRVGVVISGGNIDMMVLSSILQRGLVRSNRLTRINVEIPDNPGAMSAITAIVAEHESNIVDIQHQRAFSASSARATVAELVVQTRGSEQEQKLIQALEAAGFPAWT